MELPHDISSVLTTSSFEVLDGTYVFAKTSVPPPVQGHFLVVHDGEETTVVTRSEKLEGLALLERHPDELVLVALNVSVPFYAVGFLASVSSAMARRGINVLIVSAYSRDFLLVRHDRRCDAVAALVDVGMHDARPEGEAAASIR
jgi:hypothetical protein